MLSIYATSRIYNSLNIVKRVNVFSRLPTRVNFSSQTARAFRTAARDGVSTGTAGGASLAKMGRISRSIASLCIPLTTALYAYKSLNTTKALCDFSPSKTRVVSENARDELEWSYSFPYLEFLKVLLPDIGILLAAILAALAAAFINVQIPAVIGEMANVLAGNCDGNRDTIPSRLYEPAVKLLRYSVLQAIMTASYISMLAAVGERSAARMRCQLFNCIINQDIEFFDSHKTGELISRLTTDVQDFKSSFKLGVSQGLRCVTQVIGSTYALYTISPLLTGVLGITLPMLIGVGTVIGGYLRKMSSSSQAQVAKATSVADEAIGNVRTVRAFAMESTEISLYNQEIEKSSKQNQYLGIGIGIFQGLSNMAINGIVLAAIYGGGLLIAKDMMKPGDLMSFIVASQNIQRSLSQVSVVFGQVIRGMSAGSRVFEYMFRTQKINIEGGKIIPYHSIMGNVEFKSVNFAYPTRREQTILEDFNLKVPGGTMVALVGLSGNGKSTVASLLDRFYDVNSGSISIDGYDIRELDPRWLRGRAIAFISQEPVLFATTIMENIRYGKPGATDSEVIEAAKLANADDFINTFPDGYDTVLGERGVTISGGQKQRVAIARALIKKPSILILDEATSALDTESEQIVQGTLNRIMKEYTVIVIAHRLSTVKEADNIVVMSNGKIVEAGTHDELRQKKGPYWNLIKRQEFKDKEN